MSATRKRPLNTGDEAEVFLRRFAALRSLGLDELDAQSLAAADVNYAEIMALIRKGCPLDLLASILA